MAYSREQVYCIFCGNNTNEKGRIQFNEEGNVIGCCEHCLKYAELFVKEGVKCPYKYITYCRYNI